ncbi:MAG TPA: alpha/beta hydrolase [Anaerolineaceae bacterium]|nr:alpha/beta hydrolase [Anaerolineaceae bacterium]
MPYFNNNHHRLFYREQGSGPLLVILPGNTATSACHVGELEYFAKSFHCIAIDFWGTGQSDRMETWPEDWFERAADDAAALAAHAGEGSAFVLGTSGGAWVALLMAIAHPGFVRAVVADSMIEKYPPEALLAEMAKRHSPTPDAKKFYRYAQGEGWEQVVEADTRLLEALANRGGDLFQGRLAQIRCPVLLTNSIEDFPAIEPQTASILRQIPNSRALLLNRGGHPTLWSRPDEVREAVETFFTP